MERIVDYVSGKSVPLTPEESEAVQPLVTKLINEYGYRREDLITHPQYRIKTPSESQSFPIDIAVFEGERLKIIAECKRKNRKDGLDQLKKYLNLSEAQYGILYNGEDLTVVKKRLINGKLVDYFEINDIPRRGINQLEAFKKIQLRKSNDLKSIFKEIHSHISSNVTGATTSLKIADELIRILFCKIWDERYKSDQDYVDFFSLEEEKPAEVAYKIKEIFKKVKKNYPSIFQENEWISLDDNCIKYVVDKLRCISLMESERDSIADAFEVFVGKALKGDLGQFFTPRNIIRFILKLIDQNFQKIDDSLKIMDPACGTGGFIVEALDFVWKKINKFELSKEIKNERRMNFAQNKIYGIDKDNFVSKVTKAYMCILGDGTSQIKNQDSLNPESLHEFYGKVDLILTNPPFGKKIKVTNEEVLKNYELRSNCRKGTNPEVLFLELCVKLLKKDGIMAIVLPEGLMGNKNDEKIRKFLVRNGEILAVVSLPIETFKPHTGMKSSILIFRKKEGTQKQDSVFICVNKIGHDKNGKVLYKRNYLQEKLKDSEGNYIIEDDLDEFLKFDFNEVEDYKKSSNPNLFRVPFKIMQENNIRLYPTYYFNFLNKIPTTEIEDEDRIFLSVQDLIDKKIIESSESGLLISGISPSSRTYVKREKDGVPFYRTSDIKNLEITRNPQKYVRKDFYDEKCKKILRPYDVVMAKDGDHCAGEIAMVMPGEERALLQSHICIFRSVVGNSLQIDNFNLIAELNSNSVVRQIKAGIFTQGTIPTLTSNLYKIRLSFLKDSEKLRQQSDHYKEILETRFQLKEKIKVS